MEEYKWYSDKSESTYFWSTNYRTSLLLIPKYDWLINDFKGKA